MKVKISIISAFTIALIALICFEVSFSRGALNDISSSSEKIIEQIEENIENDILESNLLSAYENWKNTEYRLLLIYNHKDLLEIGKELNQAISYIQIDNKPEALVHLRLMQEDLRSLQDIICFDYCNIL